METRPSPYHAAETRDRVHCEVDAITSLIACVTPVAPGRVRLGLLINGKETSITVPFEEATRFFADVQSLMGRVETDGNPTQSDFGR